MFICSKVKNGFTLIELLVVISILSLLSSILLVALYSARDKARNARIQLEVLQVRNLLEEEKTNSKYPSLNSGYTNTLIPVARYEYFTPKIAALVSDILTMNRLDMGNGYSGNFYAKFAIPDTCEGAVSSTFRSDFYNAFLIFTNTLQCTKASEYAIYAAYGPKIASPTFSTIGSGYFCADSAGNTLSRAGTEEIPRTPAVPHKCQ